MRRWPHEKSGKDRGHLSFHHIRHMMDLRYRILSEELQKKALGHLTKRMDLREPPPPETIYDFSFAAKARSELAAGGWKP